MVKDFGEPLQEFGSEIIHVQKELPMVGDILEFASKEVSEIGIDVAFAGIVVHAEGRFKGAAKIFEVMRVLGAFGDN